MDFLYYAIFSVFGLAIGSFLNVLIDRLPDRKSILGRSSCEDCGKVLGTLDLIPVLSWLYLRGRCRYCRKKLRFQYPAVELSTSFLFIAVFHFGGFLKNGFQFREVIPLLYFLFIVSVFVVTFLVDLKHQIILEEVIYPAIFVSIAFRLYEPLSKVGGIYLQLKNSLNPISKNLLKTDFLKLLVIDEAKIFFLIIGSSVITALFFWLIVRLTRGRGMGEGDIPLSFLVGLVSGLSNGATRGFFGSTGTRFGEGIPLVILSIFLSFIVGAGVSLLLMLFKRKGLKDKVPFGPFLVTGTLLSLFFGDRIIYWYLVKLI